MEKLRGEEECGITEVNPETSPAQKVLDQQGEILSCGGVYLAPPREPFIRKETFQFVSLPNKRQEVMVLKNHELLRVLGEKSGERKKANPEGYSSQDTIRRFFRESLN